MERPVITGAATVTALGRNLKLTRDALRSGQSAIHAVDGNPSPAARIGVFTTEPEMSKAKARRLDRGSQYAVVAARQCLSAAAYEMAGREERTGILLGTGSAGAGPLTEFERQMAVGPPDAASPFLFPYTVANAPASVTAIELGIKGPNVTIIQKDPAALNALLYARMLLADGRADALLVGAADEWNLVYHEGYERVRATRTATRPGFALGEGAGLVLVETTAAAAARGARPWAVVAGVAQRPALVSPHRRRATPDQLRLAMEAALADAGCSPSDVGLVHLQRNGVPWMDAAETAAVTAVFGDRSPRLSSVKLQLGENPVLGGIQLALGADALQADPSTGAVLVNGFGAGGNFIAVVLTAA